MDRSFAISLSEMCLARAPHTVDQRYAISTGTRPAPRGPKGSRNRAGARNRIPALLAPALPPLGAAGNTPGDLR
jgi:hypothetical protein